MFGSMSRQRPVLIVAELSGNHLGSLDRARALVEAAAGAGADAVKLQTYTADSMTVDADMPWFRIEHGPWAGRTLHELYREAATPYEWHAELKAEVERRGMLFLSAPFDPAAVEFLEHLGMEAYKIASPELVDLPLLRAVGATGKPVILSTGMATVAEIDEAVATLRAAGCPAIALLKCTSAYPAPVDEMNLETLSDMQARWGLPVGLSDHSVGIEAPVVAVALGARLIEKHLTMSRADGGPDAGFSLEPREFSEMVAAVRTAERALGQACYGPTPAEEPSLPFRRSLFVVADVRAGEELTVENVRAVRPAAGLHTRHLEEVLGRRAARDVPAGTPLGWDLLR